MYINPCTHRIQEHTVLAIAKGGKMNFIPQILLLVLALLGLGGAIVRSGTKIYITIIAMSFLHAVLYWGGWYDGILSAIGVK